VRREILTAKTAFAVVFDARGVTKPLKRANLVRL
jgi:hypothetical protein